MQLRTQARDCLYLNWAVPCAAAPPIPAPLRYEVHACDGGDHVLVSALLFRLSGLHAERWRWPRLGYPQANVRLYVLDGDGVPSVLFVRMLVPFWMLPAARWIAHQPARAALFGYPRPSQGEETSRPWCWRVRGGGALEVTGRIDSPRLGPGPRLGSWQETVDHLRQRPRGYVADRDDTRRVTTSHPTVAVWPLRVEVHRTSLLDALLPAVPAATWRLPHSAWLCPEIPFRFQLDGVPDLALRSGRVPAPGGA